MKDNLKNNFLLGNNRRKLRWKETNRRVGGIYYLFIHRNNNEKKG